MTASRAIATMLGIGLLPWAPGTWASAAAIPLAWAIHGLGGFPALLVATIAVAFAGWLATRAAIGKAADHDPPEIVVDEVAGQWVALCPLSAGLWLSGADAWSFPWTGWVCAFVAFRVFDMWKPWPVSWADRREDALGVMLDDLLAGMMAAAATAFFLFWSGL